MHGRSSAAESSDVEQGRKIITKYEQGGKGRNMWFQISVTNVIRLDIQSFHVPTETLQWLKSLCS